MYPFSVYRRSDWPRLAGLALLYALTVKISLAFVTLAGTVALLWIPSGLALAMLLIYGKRYWPPIFVGLCAVVYGGGHAWLPTMMIGIGNTLEALFGLWLLTRYGQFDRRMGRAGDFFLLSRTALLGPLPAVLLGTLALVWFGMLPSDLAGSSMLRWWMGDMLSILLVTPLILVWRHRPSLPPRPAAKLELLLMLALTLLFGQLVFFDWMQALLGPLVSVFLMFIVVIWSAMRFGRHITLLVLTLTLVQAVWSAVVGSGFFANDWQQTGLVGLWIYLVVLVAVGMMLASAAEQGNASQQALQESNARFTAFMEHLPGLAYIKDAQRRYIFANKGFERPGLRKLPATTYLDKTMEQLDPVQVSAATMAAVRAADEAVLTQRQVRTEELTIGPLSDRNTLLAIKFPIVDPGGHTLIGGITLDISERKRADARIRRLTQLYKALSEVSQSIVRLGDAAELFPLVCRAAVEYGGAKMAWIGRCDPADQRIVPVASHGSELGYLDGLIISARDDLPEGRDQIGTAYRENRVIVSNDLGQRDHMELWRDRVARHGFNACASFPIPYRGQPFAVFTVYQEQCDAFDAEAVKLLEEMANDVSFALDNFDRERQRRQALEALRASEQHFRAFFERSMVGMATSGADKRWLDVNAALCDMLGYTQDELLQLTWAYVTHPDDLSTDVGYFEQTLRGENDDYAVEKRLIRKDGGIVHAQIMVRCLRKEDGSVDYFAALFQDITEQKQSEEMLWRQANFDPLTSLPNRRMFGDRLEQEIKKRHHGGLPLALLFIDLDHFKEVNDTLGHGQGDLLLVEAARRIQSCVRGADTVARLGGDEFMIILTELPDGRQVENIARTLLQRLTEAFQLGTESVYVSASIGITLYPADADSAEQLIRNADQAMYAAKNLGRNRFSYFTSTLQDVAQARQKLINDMRSALAGKQFQLYFQPIVELADNRIVKAEALLRWIHPERGMISPLEFIPLAEETGLIIDIGNWVFREAAGWAQHWTATYAPGFQISVNTSPVEFQADSYDPAAMIAHLQQIGLAGSNIVIEITEGMLLHGEQRVMDHFMRFRDAGLEMALDDFGTGYSSLASLKKFDIDYLKIDQAFVRNLANDANDMALSEAIIVMAHKLGLQVVAEGIETERQRELLLAAGCDFGQGYLFSQAVPPSEFEALLAAQAAAAALTVSTPPAL